MLAQKIKQLNRKIDDRIDIWHESPEIRIPLHTYLGWTWQEYAEWVRDSSCVPARLVY